MRLVSGLLSLGICWFSPSNGELHEAVNPEIAAYMVVSGGPMIAQMKLTKRSPEFIDEYLNTSVHGALMPNTDH